MIHTDRNRIAEAIDELVGGYGFPPRDILEEILIRWLSTDDAAQFLLDFARDRYCQEEIEAILEK